MKSNNVIDIGSVSIPTSHFMIAWCAWLGIKKAGKTYGAKGVAEQLMEQGVPLVVFDAIGMWRHLKVPSNGRDGRGYEVVVAGGETPDIPLTAQNAAEIVRAAMRSNVSLIVDLYDPKLSKADWRKIVKSGFHTLLYENKKHGPRYVILEEAAEFVPQKVMDGETYAAVEKLVRMGGNVGLGGALVTPRSQEINKAVLDLCDNLVLMRQRGSAAIDAINKWMDKLPNADIAEQIASSLMTISNGQCWVWAEDADNPVRTQTHKLKSYHPDRTDPAGVASKVRRPVDTASFVSKLLADLPKVVAEQDLKDPVVLRRRIAELERALASRPEQVEFKAPEPVSILTDKDRETLQRIETGLIPSATQIVSSHMAKAVEAINEAHALLKPILQKVNSAQPARRYFNPVVVVPPVKRPIIRVQASEAGDDNTVTPVGQKILNALAELELLKVSEPVREMVALMAGYTNLASTGYVKAISQLRTQNLVVYPNSDTIALSEAGAEKAEYPSAPRSSEEIQRRVCDLIGGKSSEILRPLIDAYPNSVPREEVAFRSGYTNLASTGFVKAVSRLRTLGFIDYPDSKSMVAAPVLFLDSHGS